MLTLIEHSSRQHAPAQVWIRDAEAIFAVPRPNSELAQIFVAKTSKPSQIIHHDFG